MARQQSRESIKKEIAAAEAKLRAYNKAAAERIGNIAVKVGLDDLPIDEADLTKELQAIVDRFHQRPAKTKATAAAGTHGTAPAGGQPGGTEKAAHADAA